MVNINDVRVSNASFKESKHSLVAVFVGATSGIGLSTLKEFARNAYKPTVYILGRSRSAAGPLLNDLTTLNPQATFCFIETEISLIKNVDKACEAIAAKEDRVDLLFMSPGYISLAGREGKYSQVQLLLSLEYKM
jgi:NADP-dependent 3-hydroxy acid dehydrogenase YdfG